MTDAPAPTDEELARFIQGPVSAMLGTADATAVPDATRVAGVAPLEGRRLRILISADARAARANAVVGARVAVLVTDITSYRSVQWKGWVVSSGEERTPGDIALFHRHVDAFSQAGPDVGIPREMIPGLFPREVVPLIVEVDAVYNQTPGPGAGGRIGAVA
ncbi:MAG: pyridoxamine 5'-phosphate oxidase family protein [Actinomycetota bacterium]|nr:pyridoxamine 5'-phosphate oxidase family protein [Actinomycetota bacterium]